MSVVSSFTEPKSCKISVKEIFAFLIGRAFDESCA